MDTAIFLTIAGAEFFGAVTILGALISAVVHGRPRTWKGAGWLIVGILGLPMTALALAYIVGFPIVLAVFWVSAFCVRWPRFAYSFVGLCVLASTFAFGWSASTSDPENLVATGFLCVSAACGLLAFAKLGRICGTDWLLS